MKFLPIAQNLLGTPQGSKGKFRKTQTADFADLFAKRVAGKDGKSGAQAQAKHNVNAEDFTLSRDDVLGLMQELSASGISSDRLNRMNQLLNSDEPITPQALADAMRNNEIYADLTNEELPFLISDAELRELNVFFQKLGFSMEEASKAVDHLRNGGDVQVWAAMSQRLNALDRQDPTQTIDVSAREIDTLAKLLRLDTDQRETLAKLFAGEDKQLTPTALQKALGTIAGEMARRNASDGKLDEAMQASLEKIRTALAERQKIEQAADNRGDKDALQKQAMYKDSATAKADGMAPAPIKDSKQYSHDYARNVAENAREGIQNNEPQAGKPNQHGQQAQQAQTEAEQDLAEHNFSGKQQNDKQDNRAMTGRGAEARTADKQPVPTTGAENTTPRNDFAAQMNQPQNAPQQVAQAPGRPAHTFSQQVMQQVETGIMRSLQDGTKQLTIQLTPEDLGTVTVLLSVKNKEVTAILRPDNPESVQAIEDQLHKLRLVMEQNGLKVERLEVRPQLQDSTGNQSWQSFDQHNSGKEMHQRNQEQQLNHMLRSRSLDELGGSEEAALIPPVIRENSSGLDVVA